MHTDDNHPLSRAILAATDRKRVPYVYRADSMFTPLEQWETKTRDVLRLALVQDRALAAARRAMEGMGRDE